MKIDGAIIKEQGIAFGIIIVKKHVIQTQHSANEARNNFQSILREFSGIPLILAAQDSRGRFEYRGRRDIVEFLASVDARRIPWKSYTYNFPSPSYPSLPQEFPKESRPNENEDEQGQDKE
jgi:hypothetical protein